MGDPIPKRMGYFSVSCAKTGEPIEMPFWMKTRVGPRNHVLDWGADPQGEGAIFGGCPGHSKALAIFAAFATVGIIQSPITSCSSRDHSVSQIVVWKFLCAVDAAYRPRRGGAIAQRGRSVISTIAFFLLWIITCVDQGGYEINACRQ